MLPQLAHALDLDWTRTGKDTVYGEMTYFDFERKTVTIQPAESEGESKEEIKFPSSELDSRSRWMAMFSPHFLQSLPSDNYRGEHLHLALLFIVIPAVIYLFSFWLSAILITQRINPLRAIIALPGAWFLSGFLIVFYIFMIGRYPEHTLTICSVGGLITLCVAALFVSIIYHKSVFHGLVLIIFHSVLAPIIFASAIYASYKLGDAEKVDQFFEQRIFTPTGLLAQKDEAV
ncbi:MAG: hypothetical protein L3J39_11525 [Verrucomicrobiales bacterium]|nr:hypothetical protein [Verrucomicrobiales bacterium]